uniref:Non-specific serine/threonine protein kinase n=2 Tax=Amphora coffeiformis TaxID=265554 RepID=A0A7S3P5Y3_9STRA|mmetsp:Transcript_2285/g.4518  ORF Transcript_2285/g.4518 Transcript_2285/m.4518 type:complete len:650 (+) Transcript_2285:271-2220(+)
MATTSVSNNNNTAVVDNVPVVDFAVYIVGCGPWQNTLVYAILVSQPVQSWTVVRHHEEFVAVSHAAQLADPTLPPCPHRSPGNAVVPTAQRVQAWMTTMVRSAAARATLPVREFFTTAANTLPAVYEGVPWTNFATGPLATATAHTAFRPQEAVADFDMDDMFAATGGHDDDGDDCCDEDDGGDDYYDDDGDAYPRACDRYKPTDETLSSEDEMEILNMDEVEMIEDLGSLAQSLGASHLGRSLQLQAEMTMQRPGGNSNATQQQQQHGLQVGGAPSAAPVGGLGSAMMAAADAGTEPPPPAIQPRLDSFKMIKVIGKGSFGKVFLVSENKTGEMYALKVLRKDNVIKRNQVEHTRTERNVLGYVKHPFIVGMNMAFQSKDKLYFVLDYCPGGELFFHLGKLGKFPEGRARFYTSQIILAISYVHSLDIVYRDLKPENVLLDANGHIRLTDFGLSKEGISNSSSGANSFCGTPEYLAPEILNRQGHGRAVDWWSLGALLYEMLTSLPPFYSQDRERLFEKIRNAELTYPPSVSPNAKSLLKGLLMKDPTRRLGSGPTDAEEIKSHVFFHDIQWEKLFRGEIPAPWRPNITNKLDTSQFDKEFTNMKMSPQSFSRHFGSPMAGGGDMLFEGFTFTDRSMTHNNPLQRAES